MGSILEVVDWDETTGQFNKPVDLDDPRILIESGRVPSPSDPMFRQQMVYAVCTSTYNAFRLALGRDPCWGFLPGLARLVQSSGFDLRHSTNATPTTTCQ